MLVDAHVVSLSYSLNLFKVDSSVFSNLKSLVYFFVAVNKAYKTLENEEGFKRCKEIIDEAKERVEEMVGHLQSVSDAKRC